jgi:predicted DNA-binding transcriptional regulator AlpA
MSKNLNLFENCACLIPDRAQRRRTDGQKVREDLANSPSQSAPEPNDCDAVLTTDEAAKFLRMSVSWLAKNRNHRSAPPYVPFGRNIRYLRSALIEWMRSHSRATAKRQGRKPDPVSRPKRKQKNITIKSKAI